MFILVMVCQSAEARLGSIAAAIYVGGMALFVVAYPREATRAALADYLPWLHPALALASILWSDAASTSLRMALELCFTTATVLAVSRRLSNRDLISGLMMAMLICGGISFALAAKASLTNSGVPLIGIYGSKNQLAFHMVLMVLCSVSVILDGAQPGLVRLLAVPSLFLGLLLARGAHSTGAVVMGALAVMVLLGVASAGGMPRRLHGRLVAAVVIMSLGAGVLMVSFGHDLADMFFTATGKDAGLTGRTFLWQRAAQMIADRPTLGYGYQAFWRQDYPEAEALWRYFKIANRTGFHFHDLYYEVTVELGFAGLAAIVYTLAAYTIRTVRQTLGKPGPQTGFLLAICLFLLARSGIEVDLTYPMGTVAILFPMLLTRFGTVSRRVAKVQPAANSRYTEPYAPWVSMAPGGRQ
jgi:exopolysaccharide production protein ExoQ